MISRKKALPNLIGWLQNSGRKERSGCLVVPHPTQLPILPPHLNRRHPCDLPPRPSIEEGGLEHKCAEVFPSRVNDRIQVFDKRTAGTTDCQNPTGTPGVCGFVGEFFVATDTLGPGSTWDIDVSPDNRQKFLYNADGSNNYVWTLRRKTGAILGTFGRNGRSAGQFHWVHNMAVDSKGNLYTAEVDTGKRVQKFMPNESDRD